MFSKLRRSKSEKVVEPPKLRGMPALKQMRSSKRIESYTSRPLSANSTDFERLGIPSPDQEMKYTGTEDGGSGNGSFQNPPNNDFLAELRGVQHREEFGKVHDVTSTEQSADMSFSQRENVMYREDILNGIPEDAEERNGRGKDGDFLLWRNSKGDSGYKSKDELSNNENKKQRRSRKKTNGTKQKAKGLHTIKQQRKASREDALSQSMRALTPRERESIRALEDVLKDHSDEEDERYYEVFDTDSSSNDFEEQAKDPSANYDVVDYGYASVHMYPPEVSRKSSLESNSSVGSIIDLVSGPSAENSPLYSSVQKDTVGDFDHFRNGEPDDVGTTNDVILEPEQAINELDEVILSFSCSLDENDAAKEEESPKEVMDNDSMKKNEENSLKMLEEQEGRMSKKKKESKQREKGTEERKKKKEKGVKKKDRAENPDSRTGSKSKKDFENTHSMTSQPVSTPDPEPIYAQVIKPRKNNDEASGSREKTREKHEFLEPPSPFNNSFNSPPSRSDLSKPGSPEIPKNLEEVDEPTGKSSRHFWEQLERKHSASSDPLSSPTRNSYPETQFTSTPKSSRPSSTGLSYNSPVSPQAPLLKGFSVSESVLHESTLRLKKVDQSSADGTHLLVNPDKHVIREKRAVRVTAKVNTVQQKSTKTTGGTILNNSSRPAVSKKPVIIRPKPRSSRPVSLHLDESGNLVKSESVKPASITIKPHSSFREDKREPTTTKDKPNKNLPFNITSSKRPISLY